MRVESFARPELALVVEGAHGRDEALERLADAASTALPGASRDDVLSALREREEQMPTSTNLGIAFPHALLPGSNETLVGVALLSPGVDFGNADHPPVDLVFCLFGGREKPWEHVSLLARLARIARAPGALERLRACSTAEELHARLLEEDRSHG